MSNTIKKCLIGAKYIEEITELRELGLDPIGLPQNPFLDEEINSHADILSFNTLDGLLFLDCHIKGETEQFLMGYKTFYCNDIKSPYPKDVTLNVALLGNKLFCNKKASLPEIISWAESKNIEIINTNQGYTKCNMCVLNDKAVITEDDGLSSLLNFCQIDVLKIDKGYIALSDKHYGFIGGAGVMVSDSLIYFSGDISSHPNFTEITEFLDKYNIKPVFNKNRKLRDFGGFIEI